MEEQEIHDTLIKLDGVISCEPEVISLFWNLKKERRKYDRHLLKIIRPILNSKVDIFELGRRLKLSAAEMSTLIGALERNSIKLPNTKTPGK